jgi:ABC-2 type transport system permease protein
MSTPADYPPFSTTSASSEEPDMTATIARPTIAPVRPPVRRTGPSLPGLVGIEIRKSLSTRSGKALAAAAVVLGPGAIAVIAAASTEPLPSVDGPIAVMGLLTGYLLIALGVLSTAGEWSHRTVQTTYLLVPHRGRVLAAKSMAMALMGAVLGAVSTGLTTGVLAVMIGDSSSWDGAGRAAAAAVVACVAFAVAGAGVGAAFANTPAALTSMYLVLLGVIPLLSGFKPEIAEKIDPANAVLNLGQGQSQTQSIVILAAWVVVPAVAGWIVTHRRAVQ